MFKCFQRARIETDAPSARPPSCYDSSAWQEVGDEAQLAAVLDLYPVYRGIWAVHQNEAYGDKVRCLTPRSEGDALDIIYRRSSTTIDLRIPILPGRSGFTDPGDIACTKREAP